MSRLVVENIEGMLKNEKKTIEVEKGSYIKQSGSIVQVVTNRSDGRTSYSAPGSGDGVTIDELNTSITPVFADSTLLIRIMLNGETFQDVVLLMHKDGVLITDVGYESYNTESGNVRYSGITQGFYDTNEASTPNNWFIQFVVPANDTTTRVYAPAVRSSSTTARTFHFNKPYNNYGQDAYEILISNITIMEIAS